MNIEIEKKEYVAPQMSVVELNSQGCLLCESDCNDSSLNFIGSDDEGETSYLD